MIAREWSLSFRRILHNSKPQALEYRPTMQGLGLSLQQQEQTRRPQHVLGPKEESRGRGYLSATACWINTLQSSASRSGCLARIILRSPSSGAKPGLIPAAVIHTPKGSTCAFPKVKEVSHLHSLECAAPRLKGRKSSKEAWPLGKHVRETPRN